MHFSEKFENILRNTPSEMYVLYIQNECLRNIFHI